MLFCNVVEGTLDLDPDDMKRAKEYENIKETDTLLFNEFMNMISGPLTETKYLNQNPRKSGPEIWRKMHYWNEPKTYNAKEYYRLKVQNLANPMCKSYSELANRLGI